MSRHLGCPIELTNSTGLQSQIVSSPGDRWHSATLLQVPVPRHGRLLGQVLQGAVRGERDFRDGCNILVLEQPVKYRRLLPPIKSSMLQIYFTFPVYLFSIWGGIAGPWSKRWHLPFDTWHLKADESISLVFVCRAVICPYVGLNEGEKEKL